MHRWKEKRSVSSPSKGTKQSNRMFSFLTLSAGFTGLTPTSAKEGIEFIRIYLDFCSYLK